MLVRIKKTYSVDIDFRVFDKLPKIGDEWNDKGYEGSHIYYIRCVNDEIAETTAGNPTYDYNFYKIFIETENEHCIEHFIEHICIRKGE